MPDTTHLSCSDQLKTIVRGISHELNNPNNYMMLNTDMLQEIWPGIHPILEDHFERNGDFKLGNTNYSQLRSDLADMLSGIIHGGRRIRGLLEELNSYINLDRFDYHEEVSVNNVIATAVDAFGSMPTEEACNLKVECCEDLPRITGNAQKLEQVLTNLIRNALEARVNHNERIIIGSCLDRENERVGLFVKDDGHGIPESIIDDIWNPFFSTKKDLQAIGMGLPVAKEIIKLHNGRIQIHSISQVGTEVKISLPFPQ